MAGRTMVFTSTVSAETSVLGQSGWRRRRGGGVPWHEAAIQGQVDMTPHSTYLLPDHAAAPTEYDEMVQVAWGEVV